MKTYREGDAIEFKRDTGHLRPWEPGTYLRVDWGFKDWHWIKAESFGERFLVPSRRIRKASKQPT